MKTTPRPAVDHPSLHPADTGRLRPSPFPKAPPTLGHAFRHRDRGIHPGRFTGK